MFTRCIFREAAKEGGRLLWVHTSHKQDSLSANVRESLGPSALVHGTFWGQLVQDTGRGRQGQGAPKEREVCAQGLGSPTQSASSSGSHSG